MIIVYMKVSRDVITRKGESLIEEKSEVNRLSSLSAVFDALHHVIEAAEIASLFSHREIEALFSRWRLKQLFPSANDYILRTIVSARIRRFVKFVIHQDLRAYLDRTLINLQGDFAHLFARFTKYHVYYLPEDHTGGG